MARCQVGERVVVITTTRKRVEAVIDGVKKLVWTDDVQQEPGECEQIATECAEIRLDSTGEVKWYPWAEIQKGV